MAKCIDANSNTYFEPVDTWFCEPASSSASDINAELAKIPATAPAGSIAEILLSTGLQVKMKNSQGQWIDI